MLCRNPYPHASGALFGCGQCTPCRLNKRRTWTHRMMLENTQHKESTFVTLTYDDDHLPRTSEGNATLDPAHLRNWLKRLRGEYSPTRFRFVAVGEYGDQTERPHYHAILYGLPSCRRGRTGLAMGLPVSADPAPTCCGPCSRLSASWSLGGRSFGRVFQGSVTRESCQYVAGYTVKKMSRSDDKRLNGRHPEFARQSNRPGIGAWAMEDVALSIMQFPRLAEQSDVPHALNHGKRSLPLGRYLRGKLREAMGRDKRAPQDTVNAQIEELRPLREAAFNASRSFKGLVVEAFKPDNDSLDARLALFERKKTL